MNVRRGTAILLLVTSLAFTGCRGQAIPPSDEVTTRMNAEDQEALDDAAPRRDAGPESADSATQRRVRAGRKP